MTSTTGARAARLGPPVVILVVLAVLPFVLAPFWVDRLTGWIPLAIGALGLNLLTGYNGQISVGHGALYGLGAYAGGLLVGEWKWPYLAAALGGAAVAFVCGLLIGLPALRIKGLHLAIVTLAVAVLFPELVKVADGLTGGTGGYYIKTQQMYRGRMRPRSMRWSAPEWTGLADDQWKYLVFVAVAAVCFVLVRNLVRSRTGRAMVAIRDNEIAAEVNGVNVARVKVLTFGVASALAGLGGALFALHKTQVFPQTFALPLSLSFLVAVVVGGQASILGPAIGAVSLGFFDDVVSDWLPERWAPATPLILGSLLIVLTLVAPGGAAGSAKRLADRLGLAGATVPDEPDHVPPPLPPDQPSV